MRPLSLRRILVATDVTDAMKPALQTAVALAALADAHLYIVHGGEKPVSDGDLRTHLTKAGVPLDAIEGASSVDGPAATAIVQEAYRLEADVIVMGPHRQKRAGSFGATADRVVRVSPVPCLILPRPLPLPLAKVLVPVDAAETARGPLAVGLTWASALRRRADDGHVTSVVALHVTPPGADNSTAVLRVEQEVDTVRQHFASLAGVTMRQAIDASDNPPDVILKYCDSEGIDLVVLGTRAERSPHGDILGSVSSAVVASATAPILLVPPGLWRPRGREPMP